MAPVASGTAVPARGLRTEDVPYASVIDPKTGNRKAKIKPFATGLWSRYGNVIQAPDWWLNRLPACLSTASCGPGGGSFSSAGRSVAATPRITGSIRSSTPCTRARQSIA